MTSATQTFRVLVTGAGGGGTIEIIKSLKERGYVVIALDASQYSAGFKLADVSYIVPEATNKDFPAAISQIIRAEAPNFVIPLIDEEILFFHNLSESQEDVSFRLISPRREFCAFSLDKWLTFLRLRDAGLPTPATALAGDCPDMAWPAVIKPRNGRGSRGIAYLSNRSDLNRYLGTNKDPNRFIVQQQIHGTEFTVSAVVALGGPTLTIVPKEVVVKRGITLVGITRINPTIDALCRRVQDLLRADGPFNVQLIIDHAGVPQIIEINPRYSTSIALTIASGVDEVHFVIQRALGTPTTIPSFRPDFMMRRYYTHEYVPESAWPPPNVRHAEFTRID